MKLPLQAAIQATAGRLVEADAAPAEVRVSTDTRSLQRGDTFVALRGERFDAHDFIADAVARGAAMCVIDRPEAHVAGTAALLVTDTKAAYMKLAGAARALFAGQVIGVTGSAGKTTTKTFLTQLLAPKYGDRVLSTIENENNEIGVSKLLLNASNDAHDVLVVEMGARHYSDIAALVAIARPQIGVLTNIGDAHLEIMGSRERLAAAKWALFASGAQPILNAEDAVSRSRASQLARAPHWFAGVPDGLDVDPLTTLTGNSLIHRSGRSTVELEADIRVPGAHNRSNLAAAAAAAIDLGVELELIASQLPALRLPAGRYDRVGVPGGFRLIYDAYNANASGMMAALDAFAAEIGARRIAVLASMAELGAESKALHERVGAHAAGRVDVLLVHGEYAGDLARGAQSAGFDLNRIVFVATNAQAAQWLREHARADDLVLLKGSRKYRLEEIVEELRT